MYLSGKQHPGLQLSTPDGKEIPILFAASPNASMTSDILTSAFKQMDEKNITQRGVDDDGNEYYPAALVEGHGS